MSTPTPGFEARTTSNESPAADEPDSAADEGLALTPDRPPVSPSSRDDSKDRRPRPRGFAAMDRKLVSEIARKGGKAAHTAGTAHEFTSDEAREAGRKGGRATHAKRSQGPTGQAPEAAAQSGHHGEP